MKKAGVEKQSISGQRQRREKKGAGGAETGAGASKIPVSQIPHKKRAISCADSLNVEWDFRKVDPDEMQACCYYEYSRESAAMRKSLILPTCTDQIARSTLTFVLIKAGWQNAAARDKAPLPWVLLKDKIRGQLNRCLASEPSKEWAKINGPPPFVASELPLECFYDSNVQDEQLKRWWEKAYAPALFSDAESYPVQLEHSYFFGLFRLDEAYDMTAACAAFKAWFLERYAKRKKGNSQFYGKLNQLVAMRVRHLYARAERREILIKMTGKETYERGINETVGRATGKMDVGLSRDCREACKFFQTLFPGEQPISLLPYNKS
jgi:hypothetical protein